ncbi:hypothetical protein [Nocardioides sp.]|uniref:hypothetical protein n=1 Tax=Nocardioides sp. TaxID=35761 RepID=UPI0031FEBF92|nr:hypothetical protein [Nocardioides sp.]
MLVPGVLALLPEYAGLVDPVAELRAACSTAVGWLCWAPEVTVIADEQGARVAAHLLEQARSLRVTCPSEADLRLMAGEGAAHLVVANGTARRSEKAPGYLDERAAGFDAALGTALRTPDPAALGGLDEELAADLLVGNPAGLRELAGLLTVEHRLVFDHDDDPFGVQYWVMGWQCES